MDSTLETVEKPYLIQGIDLDGNTSARDWAIAFCFNCQELDLKPATDIGLMIGWFANAMAMSEREAYQRGILAGREGERTTEEQLEVILR